MITNDLKPMNSQHPCENYCPHFTSEPCAHCMIEVIRPNKQIICTDCNKAVNVPDGYRYDGKAGDEISPDDARKCLHFIERGTSEEYHELHCGLDTLGDDEPLENHVSPACVVGGDV